MNKIVYQYSELQINGIRIPILMYHHIGGALAEEDKPFFVSPRSFENQMKFLRRQKYQLISLSDLVDTFTSGNHLPEKPLIVTFDDGSESVYTQAFPILHSMGLKATVFVTVNYIERKEMAETSFVKYPPLKWVQMKEMQEDGISFGSHSLSHPRLSQIDSDKARFEIRKSKEILQSRLGREIDFFAYPYGDMNEAVEKMVKEAGYKAAVWAWGGINRKDTNIYQLRRIPVFDSDTNLQLKLKLAFARYKVTPGFLVKYYWSRILSRMRQAAGRELQAAPEVPQY